MRPNNSRRGSHPGTQRRPAPRTVRPRVEMLESRVVPSTIDYSMGFADHSGLTANGTAGFNGSLAVLTNGGQNQAGSIFTNSKVDISQFTADFTFTMGTGPNSGGGLAFVMQSGSPTALGTSGIGLGFSGIPNVFAVTFYIGGDPGAPPNSTGTTPGVGTVIEGMDLHSTDQFEASLSYDGTTVHDTLKDLTTGATFSHDFAPIDIVSIVGSQTAFVGFSGGTGTLTSAATIQTFLGTFGPQPPPLTASGVGTISGVEGQLLQNVAVATFTGPSSSAGTTAVINWGDGTTSTGLITGPDTNGVFTVSGTQTYAEEGTSEHGGPYLITVAVSNGTSTATVTDNTQIVDAPIVGTGGYSISGTAGQSFTTPVATFTDNGGPEGLSDYSATIDWGDNSSSTGTITGPSNGVFTVSGGHTYAAGGTYNVAVTLNHETATPVTVTNTANISPSSFPVITSITPNTGQEGSGTLTLTLNGSNFASNSTAQWNGTMLTTAFISSSQLVALVPASLLVEEGTAVVSVLNPGVGTSGAQAFTISDAPLTGGAVTFAPTQGTAFTGVVATFSDANSNAPLSDFTATIIWGDGNTSAGMVASLGSGNFSISGTNTYAQSGSFPVNVFIQDVGGATTTVNSTANVGAGSNATTTILTSSANPSVFGSPVTFTALVTSGSGTPAGSVQFVIDSNISITISLTNGVATSGSISGLSVGQHVVVATYIPTGNFSPSSATLIQTIINQTSAIADGTVLLLSSPLSGQSTPTGMIGIDPSTGAQSPITTDGSFVLPVIVREAPDHQLYVVDYSAMGTGAVIAVDPNTGQESRVYSGGNINGPNGLAIVNGSLYVMNVGGSAPTLVKIDIATGLQSVVPINGTVRAPVGLVPTPGGDLYLADQGPDGVGTISVLNVQTGVLTPVSPPPSQATLLNYMIDMGLDGNGNLVAFLAGSGSGVVEVNSQTGNQTLLVSGLFSDPSLSGLVLDGGTVDVAHGGTIFASAYDPSGNLPGRLLAIDPVRGAVNTVAEGGNLSLVTGLTVFTTSGGAAAPAPPAPSGRPLHAGVAAAVGRWQMDLTDRSATGTSVTPAPVTIPPQLPGMLLSRAAAPSGLTMPRAATDSVFADWDSSLLAEAFSVPPTISAMASAHLHR